MTTNQNENWLANVFLRPSLQNIMVFLLLMLAVRTIMAVTIPLWCDEAYYNIWSEQLQFGYSDHPPMIAWWVRLGETILGDNALGTRLLPVLTSIAGSLGIYLLARELNVDKITSCCAAIWVQSVWTIAITSMIAIPDAPTSFFWILTCLCVARAARLDSTRWWIAAGAMAGLACMSKYTALFLAPGILLWLVTSPRYRSQLLRPGPWLAILSALAVFAPNIVWNIQNGWEAFGVAILYSHDPKNFDDLAAATNISFKDINLLRAFAFLIQQIFRLNPLIFLLAAAGLYQTIRARKKHKNTEAMHFIICICAPLAIFLPIYGLYRHILPYWISPIYPELALLAALGASNLPEQLRRQTMVLVPASMFITLIASGPLWAYLLFAPAHDISLFLILIIGIITLIAGITILSRPVKIGLYLLAITGLAIAAEANFMAKTHPPQGWSEMTTRLSERARQYEASWVGAGSFQDAALLHQYMPEQIITAQISERHRYPSSHPSWRIKNSQTGLFIHSDTVPWRDWSIKPDKLLKCFGQITQLASEYRYDFAGTKHEYKLYLLTEPRKNWVMDGC